MKLRACSLRQVACSIACVASLAGGCEAENALDVRFLNQPPLGLACVEEGTRRPLLTRAVTSPTIAVVTDFLDFTGSESTCRPGYLWTYCATEGCPPVGPRVCTELSSRDILLADEPVRAVAVSLLGQPIVSDAPDGSLVVRTTLVRGRCADHLELAPFDDAELLGCLHSCPLELDATERDVVLENDFAGVIGGLCDEQVTAACANLGLEE